MKSVKLLNQLKAKLQTLIKLAQHCKRYIVQVLDLEARIERIIALLLAPRVEYAPEFDWDTQPYKVILGDVVLFSAISYSKCENFITWHTKRGTLGRFR